MTITRRRYMPVREWTKRLLHGPESMDSMERKKAATVEKYKRMNTLNGHDVPAYVIHLKEPSMESMDDLIDNSVIEPTIESVIGSDHEKGTNNDFGIKIVGGEESGPDEFPYFGTL